MEGRLGSKGYPAVGKRLSPCLSPVVDFRLHGRPLPLFALSGRGLLFFFGTQRHFRPRSRPVHLIALKDFGEGVGAVRSELVGPVRRNVWKKWHGRFEYGPGWWYGRCSERLESTR